METYTWQMSDGKEVFIRKWMPDDNQQPVAVVHIVHGMAEHSKRYQWFAEKLTEKGIVVYAHDHRGHGQTAGQSDPLGFLGENGGWDRVVCDLKEAVDQIRKNHPDLPFFLFGHSMGSFLVRDYLGRFDTPFAGVVLSGTARLTGVMGALAFLIARMNSAIVGGKKPSAFMTKMTWGGNAKAFKPLRTPFDWLSRDEEQVDAYIADPLSGFMCTAGFFVDMISGLVNINKKAHIAKTSSDLPIFLLSGDMDPVGDFAKGVKAVYEAYRKTGVKDVSLTLYEGGRHEMLNEINRDEVMEDVSKWMLKHLSKKP